MVNAPVCICGSLRFEPHFVEFPMRWWLTCRVCGRENKAQAWLKTSKPRVWINGRMDENGNWHEGRFEDG